MSFVIFEGGRAPVVYEGAHPPARIYPCDTFMYNTYTGTWFRRVFTEYWQDMEGDEYITIPSTIRAWILLLE